MQLMNLVLRHVRLGSIALLLAVFCTLAWAQARPGSKRLILKDGSYQLASKWEMKGDRVRYYSTERFLWEEIPKSLVDWEATERYERERQGGRVPEAVADVSAEEQAERRAEEARRPEVAPGIRLPDTGGVFLLDRFKDEPQLVELVQSGGEINKQTGTNILRAALNPFAGVRRTIELPGPRARIQAHEQQPVFYLLVEASDDTQPDSSGAEAKGDAQPTVPTGQRFRLLRVQRKKGKRVVANLKIALTGRVREQHAVIESNIEPVSGGWIKLQPVQPLEPGEYALAEMLGEKQINLYVWDFGVDASAPENPGVWKPAPPPQTPTGTEQSPVLNKRPN
jgi:hypothetical protein